MSETKKQEIADMESRIMQAERDVASVIEENARLRAEIAKIKKSLKETISKRPLPEDVDSIIRRILDSSASNHQEENQ